MLKMVSLFRAFSSTRQLFVFCSLVLILQVVSLTAQDKGWRPVTAAELGMKTPQVEPDADAEAIFWEVRVNDNYSPRTGFKTVFNHYLRVKIFTERGRENYSKVDIPFGKISGSGVNVAIKDIAARTIKADGTILEIKSEDIFERDTVKGDGVKLKAKSFVMPGIETGAIIEYRWKEVHEDSLSYYVRLHFAREIPVQSVTYYIKPVSAPGFSLGLRIHSFNIQNRFTEAKDGFYTSTMTNVPAFREETLMPSEYELRPWILIYYGKDHNLSAAEYWKAHGRKTFEFHKDLLKPADDVRQQTAQLIGDAADAEEKIRRVLDFCRSQIKNIRDDASGLTAEQLKDVKENKNSSDTLKRRVGTWHDINMLFGTMLSSAGFDVRVANVALRSDARFDRSLTNDYFLRTENIAVRVGGDWKFFDPSSRYLQYGMLNWATEGQTALVSDASEPVWVTLPVSDAEKSKEKRTARLRLNEDGSLVGDVRIEYTGHLAEYHKEYNDEDSPQQREKTLIQRVKNSIHSLAEIKDISIENVQDPDKPFVCSFKIFLPGYAERTGKRMFVRPNIFERGAAALFRTSTRKYEISFQYAWSEDDDITITLPAGYIVENPEAPQAVRDGKNISAHETEISLSDDKRTLNYRRRFSFGKKDNLVFSNSNFSALRELFDSFRAADAHSISLKNEGS